MDIDAVRLHFNPVTQQALNAMLGFLMFGVALDTRMEDFRRVLRMPVAVGVGIAAQLLLLPALTFGLTLILQPAPSRVCLLPLSTRSATGRRPIRRRIAYPAAAGRNLVRRITRSTSDWPRRSW